MIGPKAENSIVILRKVDEHASRSARRKDKNGAKNSVKFACSIMKCVDALTFTLIIKRGNCHGVKLIFVIYFDLRPNSNSFSNRLSKVNRQH